MASFRKMTLVSPSFALAIAPARRREWPSSAQPAPASAHCSIWQTLRLAAVVCLLCCSVADTAYAETSAGGQGTGDAGPRPVLYRDCLA